MNHLSEREAAILDRLVQHARDVGRKADLRDEIARKQTLRALRSATHQRVEEQWADLVRTCIQVIEWRPPKALRVVAGVKDGMPDPTLDRIEVAVSIQPALSCTSSCLLAKEDDHLRMLGELRDGTPYYYQVLDTVTFGQAIIRVIAEAEKDQED